MVLLGTRSLGSANGLFRGAAGRGRDIEARYSTLQKILFNLCKACQVREMSCIPPSAFSARRIRETQRDGDMKLSNKSRSGEPNKYFNTSLMELTPLKYNSKLMNSIWGFYNRYSPHNVKKVNDAFSFNVEHQQSAGSSTNKNEQKISLPSTKLENIWGAVNVSSSH